MAVGHARGFNRIHRDVNNPAPFASRLRNECELMNGTHMAANWLVSHNGRNVHATTDNDQVGFREPHSTRTGPTVEEACEISTVERWGARREQTHMRRILYPMRLSVATRRQSSSHRRVQPHPRTVSPSSGYVPPNLLVQRLVKTLARNPASSTRWAMSYSFSSGIAPR